MPRVLFIAGESRSGSTLLERMLGNLPGFWPAGELRHLWTRGLTHHEPCSCGKTLRQCELWRQILHRALRDRQPCSSASSLHAAAPFPHDLDIAARSIAQLQQRVDHPRAILLSRFFSPAQLAPGWRRARDRYTQHLAQLMRAIAMLAADHAVRPSPTPRQPKSALSLAPNKPCEAIEPCEPNDPNELCEPWIIDSSKAPSHGLLLGRAPNVTVHILHLVRDPRAVAWSMQRSKARLPAGYTNPGVTGKGQTVLMPTYPLWRAALRWSLVNALCRRFDDGGRYTLLRYEDFVRDPEASLRMILRALNHPLARQGQLPHAIPQPYHTVSGNPIRFERDIAPIRADDAWQAEMPQRQRRLIETLAQPTMRRLGYMR